MPEVTHVIIFREEQRFRQWWVWLAVYGVAAIQWWGFIQQIVLGKPWGNNPGPDWMMWLFWVLFGIGLPVFFHILRLTVEVTPEYIFVGYRPLTKRIIPVSDISRVEARTYKAIREYGGYGLRGTSRNAAYNVSGNQGVELTLGDGRRIMIGSQRAAEYVVFHADRIAVSNVEDRSSAVGEIDGLVKLVNRTWENRHEIEPSVEEQRRPTPMALFKLLPATNCRQCGQPTCWNFALKLAAAQVELAQCPPLFEPAFAERLAKLQAMVVPMPAIGSAN